MAIHRYEIEISVKIFSEDDYFIAFSPELQLATQGKTIREVKRRFKERLTIFVEHASKTGTLEEKLKELGWENIKHTPVPPKEVMIPRELLLAKRCRSMEYQLSY